MDEAFRKPGRWPEILGRKLSPASHTRRGVRRDPATLEWLYSWVGAATPRDSGLETNRFVSPGIKIVLMHPPKPGRNLRQHFSVYILSSGQQLFFLKKSNTENAGGGAVECEREFAGLREFKTPICAIPPGFVASPAPFLYRPRGSNEKI